MAGNVTSRFYTSADGLALHALDFQPSDDEGRLPAVCLAGLTRGAVDFTTLAEALAFAAARPRRVIAFDYRGRGLSDHDPDWRRYDLPVERADVLLGLALFGVERAHFIGTSRGGLHIMAMAPTHRPMIASAVFNDIGPVLELAGLRRIKSYVGRAIAPKTFDQAIKLMKVGERDRLRWAEPGGMAHLRGDDVRRRRERAASALRSADRPDARCLRPRQADSRQLVPLRSSARPAGADALALRGANSDLLSAQTLAEMGNRWALSRTMEVPGQGHAPILADPASISRIDAFLLEADHGRVPNKATFSLRRASRTGRHRS